MPWNPQQYLSYSNERLRPALDLMGRINLDAPQRIVDLGCGPGNVTAILRERWPQAAVTGIDNSPELLENARQIDGICWELADVATWQPDEHYDLIFSNATLHWLDHHDTLFPRLAHSVASGGVLAVQMPRNFGSGSHVIAREVARSGPWAETLEPLLREAPVHDAAEYYRILAPHAKRLDIWETEYLHVLDGDNPVADWTRGSLLVPLLAALDEPLRNGFEAEYRRRINVTYPAERDGKTLFSFRRIFLLAVF
jgi:trans-aconitate 2-methyltransferase